jgi:hypothetical protein
MAHISQSRPDSGTGLSNFSAKYLKKIKLLTFSLGFRGGGDLISEYSRLACRIRDDGTVHRCQANIRSTPGAPSAGCRAPLAKHMRSAPPCPATTACAGREPRAEHGTYEKVQAIFWPRLEPSSSKVSRKFQVAPLLARQPRWE